MRQPPEPDFRIGDKVVYTPPKGKLYHGAERTAVVCGNAFWHMNLVWELPVAWDDMGGAEGSAHADHFTRIAVLEEKKNEYDEKEVVEYKQVIEI
jgi:hypothetical protein